MKPVVLDTNIYISAILFGGKPREIINLARAKKIELLISEYILWEIREVLRNKFNVPDSRLNTIEHDILFVAKLVKVTTSIRIIRAHPADNAILACAVDGGAKNIVSGDKHLLSLGEYGDIKIVSPSRFLEN
ncbi:MAG: putative toxin-antitoxin system toxin component, PIN family [bacterium]